MKQQQRHAGVGEGLFEANGTLQKALSRKSTHF